MTTIEWTVEWLDTKPTENNFSNVVTSVGWRCNGVDGNTTTSVTGAVGLPAPTSNFTPFENLSKDQVLTWIYNNGTDKAIIEASIISNIELQKNPPIVRMPAPWD